MTPVRRGVLSTTAFAERDAISRAYWSYEWSHGRRSRQARTVREAEVDARRGVGMIEVIGEPADIDAEWMTAVLERHRGRGSALTGWNGVVGGALLPGEPVLMHAASAGTS